MFSLLCSLRPSTYTLSITRSINTCERLGRSLISTGPARKCTSFRSSSPNDSFVRETSRRWIFNEKQRLQERYVEFRPTELQRIAAKAIDRDFCPHIDKVAEGGFNKIFILATEDGRQVIARIPNPVAGPPHYITASEVATIIFLHDVLRLPVPKILCYSSSKDNPVGAEYIIMERVHGESLASRWLALTTGQVADIMKQIAEIEQKIFSFPFPGYGSLYHRADIRNEQYMPLRRDMNLDRGPWTLPEDCLTSAARRETACLEDYARPQPRKRFLLPTQHDVEPREHISLLSEFLKLAPSLVPPESNLTAPTLRHPDLSLANILLVPGSTKIASIIDWQDTVIFPLFMQSGYPAFCQHDLLRPQSLEIPKLPENFESMAPEEQVQIKTKFRLEEANLYYTAATGIHNREHMSALRLPHNSMRQYLVQQMGYPWDADLINLRAALVGVTTPAVWESISTSPCPVTFSDEAREKVIAESQEWNESEAMLNTIRNDLRIDLEGGTDIANFEWASARNHQFRMEMLRQSEEHEREICWRNWPFKDGDDMAPPPSLD